MSAPSSYPPESRIRRQPEFSRVLGRGDAFPGREALVRRVENPEGRPRLGVSTPRRYGRSVRRNRFRRLVREAFRTVQGLLGPYDFLVSPRKGLEEPTLEGLRTDLLRTRTARPAPRRGEGRAR